MAPGICSCPDGWLGGACHTGEFGCTQSRTAGNCLTVVLVCQMVWSALNRGSVSAERKFFSLSFLQMRATADVMRSFQVSQMFKHCVLCLGSSCVFSALPERRKVHFSQQVPLPPAVLRPPLPGEEEVPLASACRGQRLLTPNPEGLVGVFLNFF